MRNLHIKVSFHGETRRIDSAGSFQVLRDHVTSVFGVGSFSLKYTDADGDLITMTTDLELQHAFASIDVSSPLRVEVFPIESVVLQPPTFVPQLPSVEPAFVQQLPAPAPKPLPPVPLQQTFAHVQETMDYVRQQPPFVPVPGIPQTYVPPFAVPAPTAPQLIAPKPIAPQPQPLVSEVESNKGYKRERKERGDKKDKKDKKDKQRLSKEERDALKAQRKAAKDQNRALKKDGANEGDAQYAHSLIFSDPKKRVLKAGEAFTQKWRVKNESNFVWAALSIVMEFYSPEKEGTLPFVATSVRNTTPIAPNEEYEFSLNFIAPPVPGRYVGIWSFSPVYMRQSPTFKGAKVKMMVKVPTAEEAERHARKVLEKIHLSDDEKCEIKDVKKHEKKAAKLAQKEAKRHASESFEEKQQQKEAKRAAKLACREAKIQAKQTYKDAKLAKKAAKAEAAAAHL